MNPMRPAIALPRLDTYAGAIPQGWLWQVKLNDERATVSPGTRLLNRLGQPIARHKAAAFEDALELAFRLFDRQLDLALLGFRGEFPVGGIVVLDLPGAGTYKERCIPLSVLRPLSIGDIPSPGMVYRLENFEDPVALFKQTIGVLGLEGIIGRRPGAGYCYGNSRDMVKSKWKN
jgi:hypothetical protein